MYKKEPRYVREIPKVLEESENNPLYLWAFDATTRMEQKQRTGDPHGLLDAKIWVSRHLPEGYISVQKFYSGSYVGRDNGYVEILMCSRDVILANLRYSHPNPTGEYERAYLRSIQIEWLPD